MSNLSSMSKEFRNTSLEDASIYDLMVALALKAHGQVDVAPERGKDPKLATSIPNINDAGLQGIIRECVGEDHNDPRSWKTRQYF